MATAFHGKYEWNCAVLHGTQIEKAQKEEKEIFLISQGAEPFLDPALFYFMFSLNLSKLLLPFLP